MVVGRCVISLCGGLQVCYQFVWWLAGVLSVCVVVDKRVISLCGGWQVSQPVYSTLMRWIYDGELEDTYHEVREEEDNYIDIISSIFLFLSTMGMWRTGITR